MNSLETLAFTVGYCIITILASVPANVQTSIPAGPTTFQADFSVDSDGFQSGLSDISVGRFAGFRDELPGTNYLLTGETTDSGLSMVFGGKKFYVLPPPNYSIQRTPTWTGTSTVLRYDRAGKQSMAVHASLLAPAVLMQFTENFWALRMQPGLQAEHVAFMTKGGLKINNVTAKYDGYGIIYDREKNGDLTEPWMLIWWQSCDQPIVLILEKKPLRMYGMATDGIIKAEYDKPAGNVTVMPLWGIKKYKPKELADWWKTGIPADAIDEIRAWVPRLQDFPIRCTEKFKLDRAAGTVAIRDTFGYIPSQSEWNIPSEKMAAVSPLIAHAFKHGYSNSLDGKIILTGAMTGYGPFPYIRGDSYTYTVPYAKCIDNAVAPLRVENEPAYDSYVEALNKYIPDPKFTYGGDYDYDKTTPLDSLHDMHLLAWSTWSLDEDRRVARFKDLQKAVLNITPDNYHHETEPFTGAEYWWDKQIFNQEGIVQFDYEWYNGLDMQGAFAYWQYGKGISDLKDLQKFYPYLQNWGRVAEIKHDWVHLSPPVTTPGVDANMDGVMHALSGEIAYSRAAHLLGDQPTADRTAYIVSKMFITWYDAWMAPEWGQERFDWGLLNTKPDPSKLCAILGYHGSGPDDGGVGFWCNTYGDCETDMLEFYRTQFYDRMKDFEYGKWEAWAKTDSSYWPTKPIHHGDDRSVMWGRNAERAVHHYCLDPHFIARALVFHETLDDQKKYAIDHSGQVIEAFIVGAHPMVLFPAAARFGGNVWDDKAKTLTTTLLRVNDQDVTVIIESKTPPKEITGCKSWKFISEHDGGRSYAQIEFGAADKIVLVSSF